MRTPKRRWNPWWMVVLALLALGGAGLSGVGGFAIGIDEPGEARPFLLASFAMLLIALLCGAAAVASFAYRRDVTGDTSYGERGSKRLSPLSVVGMLLGLGAIVLFFQPFISAPLAIAGVATSLVARRRIARNPDELTGKAVASLGLGAAFFAFGLSVLSTLFWGRALRDDNIERGELPERWKGQLESDAAPP